MLIELERRNLDKLLERYNFEHLKPSKEVYSIIIPCKCYLILEEKHFVENLGDEKRRKIFYNVTYTP